MCLVIYRTNFVKDKKSKECTVIRKARSERGESHCFCSLVMYISGVPFDVVFG